MIGRVSTLLARLRRDARGVTLLEFGLISPALILTIMAIGDLGYQSYLHAVARGVLEKAARAAAGRGRGGWDVPRGRWRHKKRPRAASWRDVQRSAMTRETGFMMAASAVIGRRCGCFGFGNEAGGEC